ncbi:MAG: hypothetical protein AVDCRST_MAG27-3415 [uncultured Craurococcus sp.]|uniref:Uncharacterized protein n=1 Tax=uncultured Craurococcus sp. TaxID=1135998 RepID=A0A6J4JGA1_9PROT|nr:MAG: hypothetical protein AVDCRST_MAG27-3415 [uncultured Craurococcus sp.]
MSGRSCSLACAVFFKCHGVPVQEAPDCAGREGGAVLPVQHAGQLHQGDIHLSLDRRQDGISIDLDPPRPKITALGLGAGGAGGTPIPNPADRSRRRNPKAIGRSAPGLATLDRRNQPGAQILRQGSRHASWPPHPASRVNQTSRPKGIPNDSDRSDFALAAPPSRGRFAARTSGRPPAAWRATACSDLVDRAIPPRASHPKGCAIDALQRSTLQRPCQRARHRTPSWPRSSAANAIIPILVGEHAKGRPKRPMHQHHQP